MKSFAQGDAGVFPTATHTGEEPFAVLVVSVELAQATEKLRSDRNFTSFTGFGLGNVDDETLAVDVARLDGEGFAEAQSALIDDGAVGAVTPVAESAEELGDLSASEDMRKRHFALDADLFPDVPIEAEMVAVKGAQAANGLVESCRGELPFVLEVDKEVENLLRGKRGEILIGEVTA